MEKVFCVNSLTNQVDSGTAAQQQSLFVSKSTSVPSNPIPDASHTDLSTNSLENSLTRTLSEEALEDESLQLLSSLDISGRNLKRVGIASSNDLSGIQAEDLRLKLHLYKVRFLLLTRNLKAAKREVKMAMNIARGKDYPLALYLKSQLEYARGNHRKAIKLLMASNNSTEVGFSSIYYNNLGCIYYRLGKHHTSGVFFSKALKNSALVQKEKPRKFLTLLQDKSLLITYNCGVHSLTCGRPFHAARCFQSASLIFYNRPVLWLRIAECCLMALEKGLIKPISSSSDRSDITVNVVGNGKWRHLALRYGGPQNGQSKYVGHDIVFTADGKQPDLSMPLARQCLLNALYLLDSWGSISRSGLPPSSEESEDSVLLNNKNHENATGGDVKAPNVVNSNGEVKEQKGGNNQSGSLQNCALDYEHIRLKENQMMKQAALADLAFVELELGNPSEALLTAKSLMELPECSQMYIFLGTVYVAEALCLLNQPKKAAELLMMYVSGVNNVDLPYSRKDCEKWTVDKNLDSEELHGGVVTSTVDESKRSVFQSPEEARGILCANYAANLAFLGDLEQAQYLVTKALSDIPNSSKAILTAIYVDIKRGNREGAIAKLKYHSGIRFLHGDLASSGAS